MNETTTPRAILALPLGAFTGAGMFVLGTLLAPQISSIQIGRVGPDGWQQTLALFGIIFGMTFMYFVAGLALIGAPLWWVAHRHGRRDWFDAAILGGVLSFLAYVCLTAFQIVPTVFGPGAQLFSDARFASFATLLSAVWMGISGATTGVTIWGIAYREPKMSGMPSESAAPSRGR